MIGNAVPVLFAKGIAEAMFDVLNSKYKNETTTKYIGCL